MAYAAVDDERREMDVLRMQLPPHAPSEPAGHVNDGVIPGLISTSPREAAEANEAVTDSSSGWAQRACSRGISISSPVSWDIAPT